MHNVVWASDAAREWRRRGPSLTVHGAYRRMSACLQLIGSDFQVHLMFHCVINVCLCVLVAHYAGDPSSLVPVAPSPSRPLGPPSV